MAAREEGTAQLPGHGFGAHPAAHALVACPATTPMLLNAQCLLAACVSYCLAHLASR